MGAKRYVQMPLPFSLDLRVKEGLRRIVNKNEKNGGDEASVFRGGEHANGVKNVLA